MTTDDIVCLMPPTYEYNNNAPAPKCSVISCKAYTESKLRAVRTVRSSMPMPMLMLMLALSLHELPVYERDVVSRNVIPGIPSSGPQPPYAWSSRWNTSGLYVACKDRRATFMSASRRDAYGGTGGWREGEKGMRE